MSRPRRAPVSIAACATMMAVGASAVAAKTVSVHLFAKRVYSRSSDPNGHPLPPHSGLAVSDRISTAFDDYSGNRLHHLKQVTASTTLCAW